MRRVTEPKRKRFVVPTPIIGPAQPHAGSGELTNIDVSSHCRTGPQPGYRHVPEAKLMVALKRHLGNLAAAAADCGV